MFFVLSYYLMRSVIKGSYWIVYQSVNGIYYIIQKGKPQKLLTNSESSQSSTL